MKKRFTYLFVAFLISVINCSAQIPAGYYNSAIGLTGVPLKAALHDIIKAHNVMAYSALFAYFQTTDVKPNGTVWDMYSDIPGGTPPYVYYFSNTCGTYNSEGDCFNREHSFPQSWFNSGMPMSSDLFHIYPTDGYVNGERGNNPYGEVTFPTWTSQNGSKLGPCTYPGYSGTVFEPIDEYKGDFARSYFYMATRYYTEDAGWAGSPMVNGAEPLPWAINLLKKWSANDTVSQKEIDRNNVIYGIQNNRNPFIDHPEYVTAIWGPMPMAIQENSFANISIIQNSENGVFDISINSTSNYPGLINVYSSIGQLIYSDAIASISKQKEVKLNFSSQPHGIYFLQLISNGKSISKKLMKI